MNNLLIAIAGLIIALLTAAFAVPRYIDWNDYRDLLEAQASRFIGRDVSVSGDVNVRLLPVPYISFQDVTVSGAPAGEGKDAGPLIAAKAFTVWLSAPPLLRGAFEARQIEIVKPHLRLVLNADGSGNWQSGGAGRSDSLFVPQKVVLQNVKITDGKIELASSSNPGGRLFKVGPVSGILTANTLDGPFKFDGSITNDGQIRKLRVSTGRVEKNGGIIFRAVMRNLATDANYFVDGFAGGIGGKLKLKGVVTAKLPLKTFVNSGKDNDRGEPLEIKTAYEGDGSGLRLTGTTLTLVRRNRPQTLRGNLTFDWKKGDVSFGGKFKSALIDLDLIRESSQPAAAPADALAVASNYLARHARLLSNGELSVRIDQMNLGGESVREIDLDLVKKGEKLRIRRLTAILPGENRFGVSGDYQARTGKNIFSGPVSLHGRNLGHFMRWAFSNSAKKPLRIRPQPFSLEGRLTHGAGEIKVEQARGDISGAAFAAALALRLDKRKKLRLMIESQELDVPALAGGPVRLQALASVLLGGSPDHAAGAAKENKAENGLISGLPDLFGKIDSVVRMQVGQVKFTDFTGYDFNLDVQSDKNSLTIRKFAVSADKGLRIDAAGTIAGRAGQPAGKIDLLLEAADAGELAKLGGLMNVPGEWLADHRRLQALSPLRLAVTLKPDPVQKSFLIAVDGSLDQSHLNLNGLVRGAGVLSDLANAQKYPMELTASLTGNRQGDLLRQVFPRLAAAPLADLPTEPATFWFAANGIPAESVTTRMGFTANNFDATLDARLKGQPGAINLKGKLKLTGGDTGLALSLFGLGAAPGHRQEKVNLLTNIAYAAAEKQLVFDGVAGRIGETAFSGRAALDFSGARPVVDIVANSSQGSVDLAALLAPLVDWQSDQDSGIVAAGGLTTSRYWSSHAFDKEILGGIDGKIKIIASRLRLAEGVVAKNAELTAELGEQGLEVVVNNAELFGGRLTSRTKFTPELASTSVAGRLTLDNARLEAIRLNDSETALAEGRVSVALDYKGRGRSPGGVVSLLSGQGSIKIEDGKIRGLSPSALRDMAVAELNAKERPTGPFNERFLEQMKRRSFTVKSFTKPVELRDGTLQIKGLRLSEEGTSVVTTSYLELSSLKLDSEWKLQPEPGSDRDELPPVSLLFTGPAAQLGRLEPRLRSKSLERFLTVLRMENEVELLEKLHLGDAARRQRQPKKNSRIAPRPLSAPEQAPGVPVPADLDPGASQAAMTPGGVEDGSVRATHNSRDGELPLPGRGGNSPELDVDNPERLPGAPTTPDLLTGDGQAAENGEVTPEVLEKTEQQKKARIVRKRRKNWNPFKNIFSE